MTRDQDELIQKSRETLQAAQSLAANGFTDSAVSRAYYAMFYVAQALLLEQGLTYSKHSSLLSAFGQYLTKPGLVPAFFHRYLIDGYNSRVTSDYKTRSNLTPTDSAQMIKQAEEFLALADQMYGPNPASQHPTTTQESTD